MALRARSLFLFDYEITELNSSLDFVAESGGPTLLATLELGYYSLTSLMTEIARAMQAADPDHEYVATADRTINGGLENRITIATDGTYLDLLFGSGPRYPSSVANLIGFNTQDYTGATSYEGDFTSGTVFIPTLVGYNYLSPDHHHKFFGVKNVSASGKKEAITFQLQQFVQVQFKYEPNATVISEWKAFLDWACQQRLFEFTPEISDPTTFYNVTLEKTDGDANGMAYQFREHLPQFPFHFDSGLLVMRLDA